MIKRFGFKIDTSLHDIVVAIKISKNVKQMCEVAWFEGTIEYKAYYSTSV